MGTERLKPLHNFRMPGDLRWGNQRQLRCMKVDSDDDFPTLHRFSAATANHSVDHHHRHHRRRTSRERNPSSEFLKRSDNVRRTPPITVEADGGIAAMREKVMLDLQTAAHKMKDAIFKDGLAAEPADGEPQRPWNLRTRRAACKTLVQNSGSGAAAACGGGNGGDCKVLSFDLLKPISGHPQIRGTAAEKSPMPRNGGDCGATASGEKRERAKFSVALSKKEIEEDFMVFGQRLPRRPKKRPRIIQKQLDALFPGLWLAEVTPDMYKVPEAAP